MNTKPRVLVISHSYVEAENQKNIAELGENAVLRVVLPLRWKDPLFGKRKRSVGDAGTYLLRRRIPLPRSQYLLLSLSLGMRQFRPDIVHVEYDPWSVIFWQAVICRFLFAPKSKLISTVKKNTYRRLPPVLNAMKSAIAEIFVGRVDHFFVVNRGVARIYRDRFGVPESKITAVQHLGVDTNLFFPKGDAKPSNASSIVIGFCGRLDENKGVRELVSAVGRIHDQGKHCPALRLLGAGALAAELLQLRHLWLEILKPVAHSEVAGFLHSLDIFVMPSQITEDHEEHDGHALIEALACGIPSIGSDSGVIPELLENGVGSVFHAGDVDELYGAILELIESEELRRSYRASGEKAVAESYSVKSIADKKMAVYEKYRSGFPSNSTPIGFGLDLLSRRNKRP